MLDNNLLKLILDISRIIAVYIQIYSCLQGGVRPPHAKPQDHGEIPLQVRLAGIS